MCASERLEDRSLLAVSALFIAGELNVSLEVTDSVVIRENPAQPGLVQVLGNGLPVSSVANISASTVTHIIVNGGDDANLIDLSGVTASAFSDASIEIEVHADNGDDTLLGSADLSSTLDGDDGDDSIVGGAAAETLDGGDGNDSIGGNGGADSIDAGDGQDTVDGGAGDDVIVAGDGEDAVDGGLGNDNISGDDGADTLTGNDGNDTLNGNVGTDSLDGQAGDDSLLGGAGDDTIRGSAGNDIADGNAGVDLINGDAGDDLLSGGAGNDLISGDDGNDTLNGGADSDSLDGGSGNDSMLGGAGIDTLQGNAGDDTLRGQAGNDSLLGGGGADNMDGGDGTDTLRSVTNSMAIDDFSITEPDSGTAAVTFTVQLALAVQETVTVDFATADGTAVAGVDYIATSGTVTFGPGVTSQTITVLVIGDTTTEPIVTFFVNLSNASNAQIADAQGLGTIVDNDNIGNFGTPVVNVAGQGFSGVFPPDTAGDVGPNHYVQVINTAGGARVRVYDKSGNVLANFLMDSLSRGGPGANGAGDGVVLYDESADRWVLMEFVTPPTNGFVIYVSQTPDPTNGLWNEYFFNTPAFPDYPKIAVWPDAYVLTTNEGAGPAMYAVDRVNMLTGAAARPMQRFTAPRLAGFGFQALTPADRDGATPPPANNPSYFMRHRDDEAHNPGANNPTQDFLELWQLQLDFNVPANSNFTQVASLPIAEFDSDLNGLFSFSAIVQPGGAPPLDPLREVIMHRLQYRNFGTHETLVGTFVTDTNATDHAGIRWFELRRVGAGNWTVFQDGLFNPDNTLNRWMSSIAMDGQGNIAIGYSVSNATTFPSMRYAGRRASDPLNQITTGEFSIINGTGSQNAASRWGDYAAMGMDPADDRTFWFTSEYALASGNWTTQVAAFRFASNSGGSGSSGGSGGLTDLGDTMTGGGGDDLILGGPGDDFINASAGNDTVLAGAGNDSILGGAGQDSLDGESGDDTLAGQGSADTLIGGEGDDTFLWNATTDGDDVVSSSNGSDQMVVTTGTGADAVSVGQTGSSMTVTSGGNVLAINPTIRIVSIDTGAGNDTVTIGDVSSVRPTVLTINGNSGNDTLTAGTALLGSVRLRLNGNDGDDIITGSLSDDTIDGGAGRDALAGNLGNDTLLGGADADTLNGNKGDDLLQGDDGADALIGGDGNDVMQGGLGSDNLNGNAGADTLDGNAGADTLQGAAGNDSLSGGAGRDSLVAGDGDDTVDGGRNDDTIFADAGNDTVRGDHGHDLIDTGAGDDTINGGHGDDTITSGSDNDLIAGGDGNDSISTSDGDDTVTGGDGSDTIVGGAGNDVLLGDNGADLVNGQGSDDTLAGGEGVDTLVGALASEINESFTLSNDLLDKLDLI